MKKTTLNAIANVTVIAAGLAASALAGNETVNRYKAAIRKATKDTSRQLENERLLNNRGKQLTDNNKIMLLTGGYKHGKSYEMDYAEFFTLCCAGSSLYEEDQHLIKTKFMREDGTFRSVEKCMMGGKLFIFIVNAENKELYNGGAERTFSYRRIVENGNINGTVYVFDVKDLEDLGYDPSAYGDSLVSD